MPWRGERRPRSRRCVPRREALTPFERVIRLLGAVQHRALFWTDFHAGYCLWIEDPNNNSCFITFSKPHCTDQAGPPGPRPADSPSPRPGAPKIGSSITPEEAEKKLKEVGARNAALSDQLAECERGAAIAFPGARLASLHRKAIDRAGREIEQLRKEANEPIQTTGKDPKAYWGGGGYGLPLSPTACERRLRSASD